MRRSFTHRNLPVADGERPYSPALCGSRLAPGVLLVGDKSQRYNPLSPPSGFRPRIGVRGMLLIAGIAMALRRPHKRMKVGRWVGFFHRLVVLPLPTPPGFRPRIGVRGRLFAGMTNGGPD